MQNIRQNEQNKNTQNRDNGFGSDQRVRGVE